MGHVFWRDFAYNKQRFRLRMATGSIGEADAKEFARLLSGPMIEVEVGSGEAKQRWMLHQTLLIHHSELLEEELDGKKKGEKLELPEHDPAGFELFVKWIYQGKLDDVADISGHNQQYEHAVSCHKLYLLCERFGMEQLKNVAIDQYRRGLNLSELVPDADEINEIYRKSPPGSPWRKLTTQIAARQIMDPESHREVSTYKECFVDNPDFAIDLVTAIKEGTGGMLFADPTEPGNECEYHDHASGPNCHIRGKGKGKQVLKTRASHRAPRSSNSDLRGQSDLLHPPHRPPRLIPNPQPRHARRQNEVGAGPLRRRLTSPASSTIEMSTETATVMPPSPRQTRNGNGLRRPTPPEKTSPTAAMGMSHPAQDAHPRSSDAEIRPTDSSSSSRSSPSNGKGEKAANTTKSGMEEKSPRGIWEWARIGRIGLMNRKSEVPGSMTSKAATSAVSGALNGGREIDGSGSLDDFSLLSSTCTDPENATLHNEAAAAKMEGLGISSSSIDASLFSQTKRSSDDLVASMSVNGTEASKSGQNSPPAIPSPTTAKPASPTSPKQTSAGHSPDNTTPNPHRIPKYKIALASHILSSAKTPTT